MLSPKLNFKNSNAGNSELRMKKYKKMRETMLIGGGSRVTES